ncbi:hypothetical protein ACIA5D_36610 [Actinoplanes sp. NPDC051513]|uniref:hypothetical protein n=1 Tax=Actinoplanes sp. NPDC051513 TaxID=3363908 RepID=UPI00379E9ACB
MIVFEIAYASGGVVDKSANAADIEALADLLKAKARGDNSAPVKVNGLPHLTVGDIRSLEIRAEW